MDKLGLRDKEFLKFTDTVGSPAVRVSDGYNSYIGSIVTASAIGSDVHTFSGNTITSISVKSPNSGSTYKLGIYDTEGFLIQPYLTHTGDWIFQTPTPVSGGVIFGISGAQVNSLHSYKVVYK